MTATAPESSLPASLWAATARPAPPTTVLSGHIEADVAIVGAGYTGLSAALHLAEAGAKVAVIDAHEPGWGASGRNGGQVNPGLKHPKAVLERMFGAAQGSRLYEAAAGAPRFLFDLVRRLDIDCGLRTSGTFVLAHTPAALATLEGRAKTLSAEGVSVRMLDATAVTREVGTSAYVGGMLDSRGGNLHPLSYARGLAAAAIERGAALYRLSPATRIERAGDKWSVATPSGAVRAGHVVVATNGYTDRLWPKLAATVLPVNSFQIATEPLPPDLLGSVLPGAQSVYDSRRLILYFRLSDDGRLVLGGRASFSVTDRAADYDVLRRVLDGLFPQLARVQIAYRWSGRVAITQDFLPHLHELAPRLFAALGYNGRGVAMATLMGKLLADLVVGKREDVPFPITALRPIPFHPFRQPVLHAVMQYQTLMDAWGR